MNLSQEEDAKRKMEVDRDINDINKWMKKISSANIYKNKILKAKGRHNERTAKVG